MPTITQEKFGQCPQGQVDLFTLTNDQGASVQISTFGCAIVSVKVPDRDGKLGEVVIGYDSFEPYLENPVSFGTIVGRYANRIGNARFSIGKRAYELTPNIPPHHLHGGPNGFSHQLWEVLHAEAEEDEAELQLHHVSPAGTNGYPGRLSVSCHYIWTNENALLIEYHAITERPTIVNLTNHSYFNLAGEGRIYDHELQLFADQITVTDEDQIPTGEFRRVSGTAFDFREPKRLGADIKGETEPAIEAVNGYDHNYVISGAEGGAKETAWLYDPQSGRTLTCYTSLPGVQLFTTNFPDGKFQYRGGQPLLRHGAVCLETQQFPDAPNQPNFPTAVLWPEEEYLETTEYWFGVE